MNLVTNRVLLLGFAITVMVGQNLALGMCHQSKTIFLDNCPCTTQEEECPCQCPVGCTTFLELELDNYAKSEDFGGGKKVEIAVSFEFSVPTGFGKTLFERPVSDSTDFFNPLIFPDGRTMLSRYCVARI